MTIAANVLKEKARRKDLYIVLALSLMIAALFSSSGGSLTMGGVALSSFRGLFPALFIFVSFLACALAISISLGTIPKEYQRKTSHLVWVRGISQPVYHSRLAAGNLLASLASATLLYTSILIFSVLRGTASVLARLPIAFLFLCLAVCVSSLLASSLSLLVSGLFPGILSIFLLLLGFFHPLLLTATSVFGGGASRALRFLLKAIPSLYSIPAQGIAFVKGDELQAHAVWGGLLALFVLSLPLLLFKKKNA